jgi:hypothetical protein
MNAFADSRPPSIEQMIEQLEEEYPSIDVNVEIIQKGHDLRTEMIESVFAEDFAIDELKKYEARISLFDKMISFNSTINTLIRNIGGTQISIKKKSRKGIEVDGSQGSAQLLLSQKDNGKEV